MISVIVPVYKTEPWLRPCVDSILAQTFSDLEIILVDDGSPDGCGAICDEYAAQDARVRVIHKENGGLVSAWKTGVQAAAGEYVGFVDSDDWIDPDFFESLHSAAAELGADVVVGERVEEREGHSAVLTREKTVIYRGQEQIRQLICSFYTAFLHETKFRWPITHARWDKLYRRELLIRNLPFFNEHISLEEDRIANGAILADCSCVAVLAHTGKYHYRMLSGSMSSDGSEKQLLALGEFASSLLAVAEAKGLDKEPMILYIGYSAYYRTHAAARQKSVPFRERCARIRRMIPLIPDGALQKYAKARGGLFIRLFCAMLQAGLAAPCIGLVTVYAALSREKG